MQRKVEGEITYQILFKIWLWTASGLNTLMQAAKGQGQLFTP